MVNESKKAKVLAAASTIGIARAAKRYNVSPASISAWRKKAAYTTSATTNGTTPKAGDVSLVDMFAEFVQLDGKMSLLKSRMKELL